jgi:hypothetical protein
LYKYTLIISQYYHSRHFFIVEHNPDFMEKARSFVNELMVYKREAGSTREMYLGDLDPEYTSGEIRGRYNINDSGDIYFLQSNYANYLMGESWEYKEHSRRESRGYQNKKVTEAISQHHDYNRVKDIVKKYFEIA